MAESEFRKSMLSLWIRRPVFSVGKYFCASRHFRCDLFVEPGKQFSDWFAIYRLICQGEFERRYTQVVFIPTHLVLLIQSLHAKQKSHFLL